MELGTEKQNHTPKPASSSVPGALRQPVPLRDERAERAAVRVGPCPAEAICALAGRRGRRGPRGARREPAGAGLHRRAPGHQLQQLAVEDVAAPDGPLGRCRLEPDADAGPRLREARVGAARKRVCCSSVCPMPHAESTKLGHPPRQPPSSQPRKMADILSPADLISPASRAHRWPKMERGGGDLSQPLLTLL